MQGQPDRRGSRLPMPPAATPSTFNRAATEQLCQVQRISAHLFNNFNNLHQSSYYSFLQCSRPAALPDAVPVVRVNPNQASTNPTVTAFAENGGVPA